MEKWLDHCVYVCPKKITGICRVQIKITFGSRKFTYRLIPQIYIENNTRAREDMEFIFSCWNRYLTRSLRLLVRYRFEHLKINSISSSVCIIFCLLYKHRTAFMNYSLKYAILWNGDNRHVWKIIEIVRMCQYEISQWPKT